jgi:transketolase
MSNSLDLQVINEVKGLIMDATRSANSGHPGGAFSSADFVTILHMDYLRFSPKFPKWHNRDRFILSAGHESMLQYSMLHLMGLLEMVEIKNFRQLGSLTPGHPEVHLTPGVEATTGPLGQGISMAVGMAMAQKHQEAVLGSDVLKNKIYVLVGDGDLQESVAIGTASIAGHQSLDNLVIFYDKNDIQISGKTSRSDSTNFEMLFQAIGWEVRTINGHDHASIRACLDYAQSDRSQPLLIIGNTTIANGTATMEGSHKTHGEPLKPEEIAATKTKLGLNPEQFFQVSDATYQRFNDHFNTFNEEAERWNAIYQLNPALKSFFSPIPEMKMDFPLGESMATRKAFGMVLEEAAEVAPNLMGGSADLEPSNNTEGFAKKVGEFSKENRKGRNIAFGVREFSMACIQNGMALYGGMHSFGATFLTFADYSRNAIRMSGIQEAQTLHVFTHDSFFVGEDGPTHQPIEHLMSLRAIPNLLVFRPADARETLACMNRYFKETHRPSLIALTRQNVPTLDGPNSIERGAFVKFETRPGANADVLIFATGSEVHVAIEAAQKLQFSGNIRVISIPCWELFWEQDSNYQAEILAPMVNKRISIEAGSTLGWQKFTGLHGLNIGLDTFGASGPGHVLADHFGFTPEKVAQKIAAYLQ